MVEQTVTEVVEAVAELDPDSFSSYEWGFLRRQAEYQRNRHFDRVKNVPQDDKAVRRLATYATICDKMNNSATLTHSEYSFLYQQCNYQREQHYNRIVEHPEDTASIKRLATYAGICSKMRNVLGVEMESLTDSES